MRAIAQKIGSRNRPINVADDYLVRVLPQEDARVDIKKRTVATQLIPHHVSPRRLCVSENACVCVCVCGCVRGRRRTFRFPFPGCFLHPPLARVQTSCACTQAHETRTDATRATHARTHAHTPVTDQNAAERLRLHGAGPQFAARKRTAVVFIHRHCQRGFVFVDKYLHRNALARSCDRVMQRSVWGEFSRRG